jgi:hypothetical protein
MEPFDRLRARYSKVDTKYSKILDATKAPSHKEKLTTDYTDLHRIFLDKITELQQIFLTLIALGTQRAIPKILRYSFLLL